MGWTSLGYCKDVFQMATEQLMQVGHLEERRSEGTSETDLIDVDKASTSLWVKSFGKAFLVVL